MHRAIELFRRDGAAPVAEAVASRVRSRLLQRRYGYPEGFLIGPGTVWATGPHASIGRDVHVGRRCRIETIDLHNGHRFTPKLTIGDRVSINDDVHIGCASEVSIGHDVLLAGKIYISDHNHGSYNGEMQDGPASRPSDRLLGTAPVRIGDRVWIGELVSVLPGVTIGEGSIIGANSVVSRDIPAHTIAVGTPARPVKRFNSETATWERV